MSVGAEECLQRPAAPAQVLALYPRPLSSPALWTRLVICIFSCKGSAELGVLKDPAQGRCSVCVASEEAVNELLPLLFPFSPIKERTGS